MALQPTSERPPDDCEPKRPNPAEELSTDFAWRVHTAQELWASKVDTKASILLALGGGALFAVMLSNGKGGLLAELQGWRQILEISAATILLIALNLSALAVLPRLGSAKEHEGHHDSHQIYFGHLRYWQPEDLHRKLGSTDLDEQLKALSRQLIEMGKVNWMKHRLVQASLILEVLSAGSLAIVGLT